MLKEKATIQAKTISRMDRKRKRDLPVAASSIPYPLDITSQPRLDDSGLETKWEKIFSTISAESGHVDFVLPPSNYFTDLAATILFVSGKLAKIKPAPAKTTASDPDPPDDPDCAVTNNFLTSLISHFELYFNEIPINQNTNFFPYIGYIARLLGETGISKDALKAELFTDDDGNVTATTNIGRNYRKEVCEKEKTFAVAGRISHGLFSDNYRYIPPDCHIRIRMRRAGDDFIL